MLFVIDVMSNVVYDGFPLMLFLATKIPLVAFVESSQFDMKLYKSDPSYEFLLIARADVASIAPEVLDSVIVIGDPEDPTLFN